ncbi:MAG TPA: cysteine--tRNA ligase [Candidatus Acidoferrales bacterium]|nr:cysteine--tRNA ligase [Candidatus Acidoferrales bacterium]
MPLTFYNTLTRSKEAFTPMSGKKVNMFVCGQTVYDDAHLGHAKTYISFDIVARWLKHEGYELTYIQNITDIDDKIIKRAQERKMDPLHLAREFEKRFMEDMEKIGVRQNVTKYPRSYDYINEIREQIQALIDNNLAYHLDGDVYFDVARFPGYTKLSGMKIDELENHRVEPKEGKRHVYDFALWKAAKEGEPSWKIMLNYNAASLELSGRPGWHIEDTAITHAIFGPQYDLHGGASELTFPHHTNEIAQSEGAYGKAPFVKYWLHSGVLNIGGVKMSKSLKNFITIRQVLESSEPEALRLFFASTHYRKEINYTEELMKAEKRKLNYLYASMGIIHNIKEVEKSGSDDEINNLSDRFTSEFAAAMNDDLNTSLAMTKLLLTIGEIRKISEANGEIGKFAKANALKAILDSCGVIGILGSDRYQDKIPHEVQSLIKQRETLRSEKKFEESDAIRAKIKADHGIEIEDTEYGTLWHKGGY